MSTVPAISVALSVYNGETYIVEAVGSILAQTFTDFEFIIIDDGSTDQSRGRIEPIAQRDSRIKFISRENRGITASANEQLSLARGRYIARMDADDVARPDRFEKQFAYMEAHPECVALGSRVLLTDPDGAPLREMPRQLEHDEIDSAHMNGRAQAFYHSSGLYRASALQQIGGYRFFNNAGMEDLDVFIRLAEVGKITNLPEPLTLYRQHMASIGHANMAKQLNAVQSVMEDACKRRGLPPPPTLPPVITPPIHQQYAKWAWWALQSGHIKTARKHALRSLKLAPFSPGAWKVTLCALRGR